METGPGKKLFRGSGIEWRERFPTLKRKHRPPISGPYAAQDRPFPIPWSPRLVPVRAVEKHIMMRTNGPRGTPSTGEARGGKRRPTGREVLSDAMSSWARISRVCSRRGVPGDGSAFIHAPNAGQIRSSWMGKFSGEAVQPGHLPATPLPLICYVGGNALCELRFGLAQLRD